VLQTENLTLLQNLAVVSRSPDITEAIVKQNYRVLSLLDQSVFSNTKQKPPVQRFATAILKTCPLSLESSLDTTRADNDAMQLLPSRLFPVCDIDNQSTSLRNQC
jgi:hypothetical protein